MSNNSVGDMMSCTIINPTLTRQLEAMGFKPQSQGGMTFEEAMICSQISRAISGDQRAYENIMAHSKKKEVMPLEDFIKWNGNEGVEECQETQNKMQTSKNSQANKAVKKPRKTAEKVVSLRGKRGEKKTQ